MAVVWDMKKIGLLAFAVTAFMGLSYSAQGGPSDRGESSPFPPDSVYDSLGRVPTVRQVQRALAEDGYYVGLNTGGYCYETRVAVRRYQRDKGLAITGKVDATLLKALELH